MGFLDNTPLLKRIFELGYTLVGLILAFPVMWLWNFVFKNFPQLRINVFQAWALNVLAGILFGKTSGEKER